jgi:hypothetical protein
MSSVVLAIVVLALLGIGALGLALLVPAIFEQLPQVRELREKLDGIADSERELLADIERVREDRGKVDDELAGVDKEYRALIQRRNMFPIDKPLAAVEHGLAVQSNKLFEAYIHNTGVRRARRLKEPPPVNPFWEEPRYVVVWAEGLSEARLELNNLYPMSKEWFIEMRGEVAL